MDQSFYFIPSTVKHRKSYKTCCQALIFHNFKKTLKYKWKIGYFDNLEMYCRFLSNNIDFIWDFRERYFVHPESRIK